MVHDGVEHAGRVRSGDGHGHVAAGDGDASPLAGAGERVDGFEQQLALVVFDDVFEGPVFDGEVTSSVGELFGFGDEKLSDERRGLRVRLDGVRGSGLELLETPEERVVAHGRHDRVSRVGVVPHETTIGWRARTALGAVGTVETWCW